MFNIIHLINKVLQIPFLIIDKLNYLFDIFISYHDRIIHT